MSRRNYGLGALSGVGRRNHGLGYQLRKEKLVLFIHCPQREKFMPVSEYVQDDLQTNDAVRFTVNELETLSYSENNLIITRR